MTTLLKSSKKHTAQCYNHLLQPAKLGYIKKVNTHTQHTNALGLGELFYTQPLCSKAVAKIKCMITIHHKTYRNFWVSRLRQNRTLHSLCLPSMAFKDQKVFNPFFNFPIVYGDNWWAIIPCLEKNIVSWIPKGMKAFDSRFTWFNIVRCRCVAAIDAL